jgi:exodeoxyribonuclease VII small subunit
MVKPKQVSLIWIKRKGDNMEKRKTYGEAVSRLEEIVASLERGGKGLDETLQLYEEGAVLLKQCQEDLKSAEGKLNELRLEDIEEQISKD